MVGVFRLILFALASVQGHGALRSRNPPKVNKVLDDLSGGTTDAKIAALKAKAIAAAARAQSGAAQAGTAKIQAQQIEMQNLMKKPELEDALNLAKKAAASAVEASKEAVGALQETKAIAKTAVDEAKRLAVEEVKSELTASYNRLDEWRNKVLTSPYEAAQKAGAKAAEPYNDMIKKFYARIGEYQMAAGDMMSKANSLASGANALAGGAQGRLDGGNSIGANQDMMTAAAMKKNSAKYAGSASALHAQANNMNKLIAEYIAAGHLAAWHAAYSADPDALPPPPVDPNYAFTPAPTTLLQMGNRQPAASEPRAVHATDPELLDIEALSSKIVSVEASKHH